MNSTGLPDDAVIALRGLHKRFGAVHAVDGVDLTIRRGEVVALLGPNGAGKTTTVDLALGLSTPTAGEVRLFGEDPRAAVVDGRVGAMLQGGAGRETPVPGLPVPGLPAPLSVATDSVGCGSGPTRWARPSPPGRATSGASCCASNGRADDDRHDPGAARRRPGARLRRPRLAALPRTRHRRRRPGGPR